MHQATLRVRQYVAERGRDREIIIHCRDNRVIGHLTRPWTATCTSHTHTHIRALRSCLCRDKPITQGNRAPHKTGDSYMYHNGRSILRNKWELRRNVATSQLGRVTGHLTTSHTHANTHTQQMIDIQKTSGSCAVMSRQDN